MAAFSLAETTALLARTPLALNGLLRHLPDMWIHRNEGADTMSPFEIVGHLIHAERTDWMPRARMILEHGEDRTFEPFDRFAQRRETAPRSISELLDEFERLRMANLGDLHALDLQPGNLLKQGRHPAFGHVTLSQLLATWATHDLTHLHQLSRVMAHQYRDEVGPWSAYLGVLKCNGHSS